MRMIQRAATVLLLSLLVASCGTVTPSPVHPGTAVIDSTVPRQYPKDAGWMLSKLRDDNGVVTDVVLTDGGRDRYNALVAKYRLQYYAEYSVLLQKDSGVCPYFDQYKNKLWRMDAEHFAYFSRLSQWERDKRDGDSVWRKVKGRII